LDVAENAALAAATADRDDAAVDVDAVEAVPEALEGLEGAGLRVPFPLVGEPEDGGDALPFAANAALAAATAPPDFGDDGLGDVEPLSEGLDANAARAAATEDPAPRGEAGLPADDASLVWRGGLPLDASAALAAATPPVFGEAGFAKLVVEAGGDADSFFAASLALAAATADPTPLPTLPTLFCDPVLVFETASVFSTPLPLP
jgi:hypothetical protein